MACTRDTTIRWNEIDTEWQNYNESWCLDLPTIANNRKVTAQLAIGRTDGTTYEDVSDYLDYAEVELGDIEQVGTGQTGGDAVVRNMRFRLRNDRDSVDGNSLHPLDKTSTFNQFNSAYNPLLWPLRETVLRVAIQSKPAYSQPKGATEVIGSYLGVNDGTSTTYNLYYKPVLPASETVYLDGAETTNYTIDYDNGTVTSSANGELTIDYTYFRSLFAGYMGDSIQSVNGGSAIECQCRDYAKLLQDTYIETKREYGSESGVPAQTVIQRILDDNLGAEAPTLYTPVDPGFDVLTYELDYKSVWDAIQEVASQFGWFLGYLWIESLQEWRLTLKEPPRTKSTGDYTLTAQDDFYTRDLDITDGDVRNAITVEYRDTTTGETETTTVSDSASINEFRRRSMTIGTKDVPLIDTSTEATNFGNALLSDLKDLSSTSSINMPLLADADLFTGFEVDDPRIESEVNFYATESIRHTLDFNVSGSLRTEVVAGSSVIGSKRKWLEMETRPGAGEPIPPERIGGGSQYMPQPTNVVATGISQGLEISFDSPSVHKSRWAESRVYVSDTPGIILSDQTTWNFVRRGRQSYFQLYENIIPGTTYYIRVIHVDINNAFSKLSTEKSATAKLVNSDSLDDNVFRGFKHYFAGTSLDTNLWNSNTTNSGTNIQASNDYYLIQSTGTTDTSEAIIKSNVGAKLENNNLLIKWNCTLDNYNALVQWGLRGHFETLSDFMPFAHIRSDYNTSNVLFQTKSSEGNGQQSTISGVDLTVNNDYYILLTTTEAKLYVNGTLKSIHNIDIPESGATLQAYFNVGNVNNAVDYNVNLYNVIYKPTNLSEL